ncbi:hypothetical protein GCM10010437_072620 [Actinoplanes palleronii]
MRRAFNVESGSIAPAFGQPGGGIQHVRQSLIVALRAAGVPDGEFYEVPGLVRLARDQGAYLLLEHRDDRWVVGNRERSLEWVHGEYTSEAEAARNFYDRLREVREFTRHPRPPDPNVPRLSRKELAADTERVKREAARLNAERELVFEGPEPAVFGDADEAVAAERSKRLTELVDFGMDEAAQRGAVTSIEFHLRPGDVVDRFGAESGSYLFPDGVGLLRPVVEQA